MRVCFELRSSVVVDCSLELYCIGYGRYGIESWGYKKLGSLHLLGGGCHLTDAQRITISVQVGLHMTDCRFGYLICAFPMEFNAVKQSAQTSLPTGQVLQVCDSQ